MKLRRPPTLDGRLKRIIDTNHGTVRGLVRTMLAQSEIKRLARILFHPELIVDRSFKVRPWAETMRFAADFFRPKVRYYVWDINDPKPFITDVQNLLRKLLKR